jgi:hypothetical protein
VELVDFFRKADYFSLAERYASAAADSLVVYGMGIRYRLRCVVWRKNA